MTERQRGLNRAAQLWFKKATACFLLSFVALIPFIAFTNLVLRHFYALGGFWGDSGVISYVMWRNPWLLMPRIGGGESFLAVHVVPIFWLCTALSWALPLSKIQFFAVFSGFSAALPALAVYWALGGGGRAAALALVFAFNGVTLAAARNPHFELLIVGFGALFLVALSRRRMRLAVAFLILCLASREDAGLDMALLLGLGSLSAGADRRVMLGFACGALAYALGALAVQHALFSGGGSLRQVYLGTPAFGGITPAVIAQRLAFFLVYRAYIWLPGLVALIWALRARTLAPVTGYIAFLPWLALQLLAVSPIAATVSNYYAFPFVLALFWPLTAPGLNGRVLPWAAMLLASFAGLGLQHNPGHLDFPRSFLAPPSLAQQHATEAALARISASHGVLGSFLVDGSVAALDPNQYTPAQVLAAPDQRPDSVVYFVNGYQAWLASAVAKGAGLVNIYEVPGTALRVASRRQLDGEFGLKEVK